jgi:hypothetical protein
MTTTLVSAELPPIQAAPWVSLGRAGSVSLAVVSRSQLAQTRRLSCSHPSTRPVPATYPTSSDDSMVGRLRPAFISRNNRPVSVDTDCLWADPVSVGLSPAETKRR